MLDAEHRQAVLVLPAPQARRPRLDHDRTFIWTIDWTGLWTVLPGRDKEKDLLNEALERAQEIVAQAGRQPAFLEQARQQAEFVLGGFFNALGWQMTILWQDRPVPIAAAIRPLTERWLPETAAVGPLFS